MPNCIVAEQLANAVLDMEWVGEKERLEDYEQRLNTTAISEL